LDGVSIAIHAGLPLTSAVELAGMQDASNLADLDASSGVALAELLRERANQARQDQFNEDRLSIQKTGVKVLWPLGLTVLPAFVLFAIVPVAAALIQDQI
jgi:hypothetical protein